MSLVRVQIPTDDSVTRKIVRDLYWYDEKHKQMLKFQGTRLEFDYKYDESLVALGEKKPYRLVPRVVVAEEKVEVKGRDSRHIMKWFRDYKNYNDSEAEILPTSAKRESVCFEVPDEEIEAFCDELDSNRFRYQVL